MGRYYLNLCVPLKIALKCEPQGKDLREQGIWGRGLNPCEWDQYS